MKTVSWLDMITCTAKQKPYLAIEWYQWNLVSISSTTSPIPSMPMEVGRHNSPMAERSRSRSLYSMIKCTWQVDKTNFQYRMTWFEMSKNRLERPAIAVNRNECLKGTVIYLYEKGQKVSWREECKTWSATWNTRVCRRCWRSTEWRVWSAERGVQSVVANSIAPI